MFNRKPQIHDMDAWVEERLSDYLDGALSAQDRALVEAHLKESARARASLESLRWTVNLLKQTPAPVLPRQFTLPVTPRAPARAAPAWMVWSLRGVAVAATAAFVILLFGTLLRQTPSDNVAGMQNSAPAAAPSAMIALAPTPIAPLPSPAPRQGNTTAASESASPMMITVEPPPPTTEPLPVTETAPAPANTQPEPTQAPNLAQDTLPPAPTQQMNKAQPATASAAPVSKPTSAAAGAGGATRNTPELATMPAPESTAEATQRAFGEQVVEGIVTAQQLKVRAGPGMTYRNIGLLKRGDHVFAIGRSEEGAWLLIEFPPALETGQAWVAAAFVQWNASPETLPIMPTPEGYEPNASPTTPAMTATPTPTLPTSAIITPPSADNPLTPTPLPEENIPVTPTAEG
jgi:hypothetical protein